MPHENDMHQAERREKQSQALFFLIFGVSAIAIMAAGYVSYINFKKDFHKQLDDQLSAVADLTVNRLMDWRSERLGDAEVLRTSPVFSFLVKNYLENPSDPSISDMLLSWMDSLCRAYQYDRVFFMDTLGNERLASPNDSEQMAPHLIEGAAKALSSGKTTFLDFHSHTTENTIRLAFLVPIYTGDNKNHPLGILVLEIDPAFSLYPILKQWPISSKTAEILLIRRDKEDVLFLNPLRFHEDAALNLHIPLTETENISVKAVLGQTGHVEGKDYREKSVIGHVRSIPDSPWFLVIRMDQDEANVPLQQRVWRTLLFISALMAIPGTGLILVLRQQRIRFYKEQIKSLEAIWEKEERLRKSEERYALVTDASEQGIWDWNIETNEVYFSRQWKKQIGYDDHELKNEFGIWAEHLHPDEKEACLNALQAYLNQPAGHLLLEFRLRHKDGTYRWIHNKAASLKNKTGQVVRMFGAHTDITERVKAAEERRAYAQKLEETVSARTFELEAANKELEAFSYSVSHDLRSPLRHIKGYINLLVNRFPDAVPEKGRHYLKNIVDSATEMGVLIDNLLQFSRAGRQEMHKTLINMDDLFKETFNTVLLNYPERIIQWETAKLPVVSGDPGLLKLVWINLLDNAIKFTKKTNPAKIKIGFTQKEKEVIFFVHDNGTGFDMQYAHKLFGVFQRLHPSSDFEGTGIGLANVRRVILRHGGRTWAEAEPGKGAVFYFTLPQL